MSGDISERVQGLKLNMLRRMVNSFGIWNHRVRGIR